MPSSDMVSTDGIDKLGPDYFTYYTRLLKDLLSQEDDFPSFSSNNVGSVLSDYKNERLNTLLQQAITILRPEVDEMLDPVLAMRRLQFQVREKKDVSNHTGAASKSEAIEEALNEKLKGEDDLQILMESDDTLVEETMKKYSDELYARLSHMESQLEEFLHLVASTCRSMNRYEKQQLQKLIQKLPPKNLSRITELIQCSNAEEISDADEVFVDLEQELRKLESLHLAQFLKVRLVRKEREPHKKESTCEYQVVLDPMVDAKETLNTYVRRLSIDDEECSSF